MIELEGLKPGSGSLSFVMDDPGKDGRSFDEAEAQGLLRAIRPTRMEGFLLIEDDDHCGGTRMNSPAFTAAETSLRRAKPARAAPNGG